MEISVRSWMESIGASCDNAWRSTWSYINEEKKFVVFGAWSSNFEEDRVLIFNNDWERNKRSGRRPGGFMRAKRHIERVENDDFSLYIFKQYKKEGEEKRSGFDKELFRMALVRETDQWYGVSIDSNSMEIKFREYMKLPNPQTGKIVKNGTVDDYCQRLHFNSRLSNYPDIKAELKITSAFDITHAEQYRRLEPLLDRLCERIKIDKEKHKSRTLLLRSALNAYKRFLESIEDSESVLESEEEEGSDGYTESVQESAEEESSGGYTEGEERETISKRYERNPEARMQCLQHHGYACKVCGFDFEQTYGEIGNEFIHVHHLKPLAEIKGEYQVDPENDLAPVCPNCHAMLHRETPPLEVADLQKRMKKR